MGLWVKKKNQKYLVDRRSKTIIYRKMNGEIFWNEMIYTFYVFYCAIKCNVIILRDIFMIGHNSALHASYKNASEEKVFLAILADFRIFVSSTMILAATESTSLF